MMNDGFRATTLCCALFLGATLVACGDTEVPDEDTAIPTYYGEAKAILDARCATCHQPGDIGPFSLTSFEEVSAFKGAVQSSIRNGTMPPWQPSNDCNTFTDNIDLTPDEKDVLLAWLDGGAPEGDPANATEASQQPEAEPFAVDISLQLPEPYKPTLEPDDHRCQLIPWPAEDTRFVTGLRVTPDQRSIVHHVIVFLVGPDEVAQYQAYDEAEEGPGYTCFAGPRPGDVVSSGAIGNPSGIPQQIGAWVPGMPSTPFPAGTGIRVEPGSMLVVQMHYNTSSSAPVADQSVIEISTTDSVEREGVMVQVVDIGWLTNGQFGGAPMTIPAGEENVAHDTSVSFDSIFLRRAREKLGLANDAALVLHSAGHHMHELGKTQRTELRHADGSTSCLLDTPDWDFNWQGRYAFANPITFRPGDTLWMGCTWDNSASNQPIVNGEVQEPVDVAWGEGTSDEMCLGGFYATGE